MTPEQGGLLRPEERTLRRSQTSHAGIGWRGDLNRPKRGSQGRSEVRLEYSFESSKGMLRAICVLHALLLRRRYKPINSRHLKKCIQHSHWFGHASQGVGERNLPTTRIGFLIVWIGWHTAVTKEISSKHAPVSLSVKNRKRRDHEVDRYEFYGIAD